MKRIELKELRYGTVVIGVNNLRFFTLKDSYKIRTDILIPLLIDLTLSNEMAKQKK